MEFADDDLDRLDEDPSAKSRHCAQVVKAFRRTANLIRQAIDERDFFKVVGPKNFYPLQGNRSHQHAFRLTDQWRLIIEIRKGTPKNTIRIVSIEDYH